VTFVRSIVLRDMCFRLQYYVTCVLDRSYYVTVRAINNIEYGPLALDVCHAQPYTVDTSPPVIYSITDVTYDEDTLLLSFRVNARYECSQQCVHLRTKLIVVLVLVLNGFRTGQAGYSWAPQ